MNKNEQFLMLVQTGLIVHYIKKLGENAPGHRQWALEHLNDAFAFGQRIPPDVSAFDAATIFLNLTLMELTPQERANLPSWAQHLD